MSDMATTHRARAEYWRGVQVGFFWGLVFAGVFDGMALVLVIVALQH